MTFTTSEEQCRKRRKNELQISPIDVFSDRNQEKRGYGIRLGTSLLEKMGQEGVAIRMNKAVPVDEILYLRSHELRTRARVRHCSPAGVDFRLGLEFLSDG
jgi:hypothetical protein